MKLKRQPDDFRVIERTDFSVDGGQFALYVLEKRSLGTLEAIGQICRQWRLPRERVSFGGLKDKHAFSRQFVTIQDGPPRSLRQAKLHLAYQGQAGRPFTPADILGNRFEIVLRDLDPSRLEAALAALEQVRRDRLPNYYDDQRFGSRGESGEFMALPWCLGDYERALWLALADPNSHDQPRQREEKQFLRGHWGDWRACAAALTHSPHRTLLGYLAHNPRNFRRAISYLPQDQRSLCLAAFQSHLWNQMLAEFLFECVGRERLGEISTAERPLPYPCGPTIEELAAISAAALPLPSARLHLPAGPLCTLIDRVLAREGLALREMRVKYPRDSFFSKGERAATFVPENLASESSADEFYEGRHKLALEFELPRGCYATILVKRILA